MPQNNMFSRRLAAPYNAVAWTIKKPSRDGSVTAEWLRTYGLAIVYSEEAAFRNLWADHRCLIVIKGYFLGFGRRHILLQ